MTTIMRTVGWLVAGLLYVAAFAVAAGLVLFMVTPPGWPVAAVAIFTRGRMELRFRRMRAAAALSHLEHGVRLNLPLPQFLHAAADGEGGALRSRLHALADGISLGVPTGSSVTQAVPEISHEDATLITAAERFGRLPQALRRIVRRERRLVADWSTPQAYDMAYPALVILFLLMLLTYATIFIAPMFDNLFQDFDLLLPKTTVQILALGRWMNGTGPGQIIPGAAYVAMLLILVVVVGGVLWFTASGRALWRNLVSHVPVVGGGLRAEAWGNVCHTIGEALRAGADPLQALREAGALGLVSPVRMAVWNWRDGVSSGLSMHEAARQAGAPSLIVSLLATGEQAGNVPEVLEFLTRHYDTRFSRAAEVLRGVTRPAIVLLLAVVVGWFVVGLFMPLARLIEDTTMKAGMA